MISNFRRRLMYYGRNPNTYIIYQSIQREVPYTGVTDSNGGWGSNYLDSKSTWDSTTGIGYLYFDGDIKLIPDSAFEQNSTMISILHIPETVTSIGEKVFDFNENVTTLRSKLTTVNFNNRIESIGQRAFRNNRRLEKLILPNSIKFLYQYLCNSCSNLSEVTIGENFEKFFNKEDNPSLDENRANGAFGLCRNLKTIHWNAINCENFTKEEYSPFSLESMGITVSGITVSGIVVPPNITTVTFGDKVKNIPSYLFCKCSNITGTVSIPSSVERIGDGAFQGCIGVTSFYIYAENPPKIEPSNGTTFPSTDGENSVFRYYNGTKWLPLNTTIYVPVNSIALYGRDPNWRIYAKAGIIQPIN